MNLVHSKPIHTFEQISFDTPMKYCILCGCGSIQPFEKCIGADAMDTLKDSAKWLKGLPVKERTFIPKIVPTEEEAILNNDEVEEDCKF